MFLAREYATVFTKYYHPGLAEIAAPVGSRDVMSQLGGLSLQTIART